MYDEYIWVLLKDWRKGFITDKSRTKKGLYLVEIDNDLFTVDDSMIERQIKPTE